MVVSHLRLCHDEVKLKCFPTRIAPRGLQGRLPWCFETHPRPSERGTGSVVNKRRDAVKVVSCLNLTGHRGSHVPATPNRASAIFRRFRGCAPLRSDVRL